MLEEPADLDPCDACILAKGRNLKLTKSNQLFLRRLKGGVLEVLQIYSLIFTRASFDEQAF